MNKNAEDFEKEYTVYNYHDGNDISLRFKLYSNGDITFIDDNDNEKEFVFMKSDLHRVWNMGEALISVYLFADDEINGRMRNANTKKITKE